MTAVAVDLGSLASKVGVARQRGIDVITNEVSNRATPSLVAFGHKQRAIGEAAKTQEISNFKNTIGSLKRLIGRTLDDVEVQDVEKKFINADLVDVHGTVGVQVSYLGEQHSFSSTQLLAMYLGKLRDIAANELKSTVNDIVIAVPGWFTEVQRRAVFDAAQITGLNTLKLINDTTAVALGYGITKSDLPEVDNPRHVVFIDVGHSNLSVAVVAFAKGQLTVKSTAYDRHLGGRDIDYALVQHFSAEFKTKYKIDVLSNPKATFRLAAGCEKLKKVLSANAEASLNVESIMNDVDVSSKLSRDEFESMISDVLNRIESPIKEALLASGVALDQIHSIELVGGSTRLPAVRQRIQAVFPGKTLSFTLNQDEAVTRGATFACAQLSPVFRVRDFATHEITPYAIKVHWERSDEDEDTELVVFPKGNSLPSTKVLTFYRKNTFTLEAAYAEPEKLPGTINPWIGRFTAKNIAPDSKGEASAVKIKVRLNQHGVFSFEQAYVEENEEKEEAPMEVDGSIETAAPKKKKIVRRKDVSFITGNLALESTVVNSLREIESQMHASDKLVTDTENRKNALEEYVYDMRGKIDERYASYVQPQEKEALLVALQESEDWLYTEEGEDATKSAYVSRLDALKKLGEPIATRYREAEERPRATSQLRETLNSFLAQVASNDEKYAHIDAAQKQSIVEKCATVQKWLDDQLARQAERPKNSDPVLTSAEILKKKDEVTYFATPILNKPKQKPKVEPTANGTDTPQSGANTPDPSKNEKVEEVPAKDGPSEMDVD